jgi:hypothetical protein
VRESESKIKDFERDYLRLNDDYSRDVKEWVRQE